MDFLMRYCGPGSIPARWQAGIFSIMIRVARDTVPPLDGRLTGSRDAHGVRDKFDEIARGEVVAAIRQDALCGFAGFRRLTYDDLTEGLREAAGIPPGGKVCCLPLVLTDRSYHNRDCMKAVLWQALTSAGKLPVICESWTGRDTLHAVLADLGFRRIYETPCNYQPMPDVNRVFWIHDGT